MTTCARNCTIIYVANRPKDKGTWAETQAAEFLRKNGWPYAERRALAGITDKGDITGCPGLAWEVKYANAGIRMGVWITETYVERGHANADHAILVIKPKGRGAAAIDQWLAVMRTWDFEVLSRLSALETFSSTDMAYSGTTVLRDLKDLEHTTMDSVIPVLVRRPPGTKEKPWEWYRIMSLGNVVKLIRSAGYGEPLSKEIQ